MNKEFIPYEEALALKELGFDEPCIAFGYIYGKEQKPRFTISTATNKNSSWITDLSKTFISIPTFSQAFRWFREKYKLDGHVTFPESKTNKIEGINSVYYDIEIYTLMSGDAYKTYQFIGISDNKEKAELACLRKLIELVKSKQ